MPEPDDDTKHDRLIVNLFIAGLLIVLIGGGVWIANVMVDTRKIQDCVAQGRRNCAPIDVPGRY